MTTRRRRCGARRSTTSTARSARDRAVRRLRDAGAVRGHSAGTRRRAQARRALRPLAHGAVRAARRRRRRVGRRAHDQPRRDDEAAASALQHLQQRARRRARRRDLLPSRRTLAAGRQRRRTPTRCGRISKPHLPRADVQLTESARRARADRGPGPAVGRDAAAARRRRHRGAEILHLRRKHTSAACRRSSRAPATPARTASNSSSTATRPRALGRAAARARGARASSPAASARATCCGWKPGMPLYGHELTEEITPLASRSSLGGEDEQAGVHREGGARSASSADDYPRIAGLVLDGRVPARAGYRRAPRREARRRGPQRFDRTVRREQEHRDGARRPRRPQPSGPCSGSRCAARTRGDGRRCRSTNARPKQHGRIALVAQPEDLLYSKEHEWVKLDGDVATIGITDYAQNSLGDIVYVELPRVGAEDLQQFGTSASSNR